MNILVKASKIQKQEFEQKLATMNLNKVKFCDLNQEIATVELQEFEIVIDLNANHTAATISQYAELNNRVILINAINDNAQNFGYLLKQSTSIFLGMNAWTGFLNLPKSEISIIKSDSDELVKKIFEKLNWQIEIVDNRVGMVTPRIIAMIINEAYFTLQERTATRSDIDVSMKLGTNYPFGPFEWATKIGLKNVYNLLNALYNDTKDERYKISPLLKKETNF